ncbi:MAG: amino-acid N-acetyltransferase [Verrucomicrobiota bacterium]
MRLASLIQAAKYPAHYMTNSTHNEHSIKPTDLRGILEYVPMFRDHIFVIAIDGSLIAHVNFQNVLLDIAVLRSLNIKVVLVHGIGQQLTELAAHRGIEISNPHGEGLTDDATLQLANEASAMVSLKLMEGLTLNGLRCAHSNAVRSKQVGIMQGVDQQNSGSVDKLDIPLLNKLLDADTVPVVTPTAFSRNGQSLRINSDVLAAELAAQLEASKLIYLTTQDSIQLDGGPLKNITVSKLAALLDGDANHGIHDRLVSKTEQAVKAVRAGTPRAHILDGRIFGALLNEIFDKVGIGTMVYSDDYESIRPAVLADAYSIYNITRNGVRANSLRERSEAEIAAMIDDYLVYEIDGSIVGCVNLHTYPAENVIEIGSVYVQGFYQNKGVGRRLVQYACDEAQRRDARQVLALTTQAVNFFKEVCDFVEGSAEDLPSARKDKYLSEKRNSHILLKEL